jgi:hypothetical protein
MLEFLKSSKEPRYITVEQFVHITQLPFLEYHDLYKDGKVPIVRKDGVSFVDIEAMAALVTKEENAGEEET